MTTSANTLELIQSTDLVDRLTGAPLDDLRALLLRLEDGARIVRAVIRERQALARRDAGWRARELATMEDTR
jgi:hypothetical protein